MQVCAAGCRGRGAGRGAVHREQQLPQEVHGGAARAYASGGVWVLYREGTEAGRLPQQTAGQRPWRGRVAAEWGKCKRKITLESGLGF